MEKGQILKKEKRVYGNSDYPSLVHWPERLLCQRGRFRITEKSYEYLYTEYGYEPAPEVAIKRKIQSKFLWWWTTIAEKSFRVPTHVIINQAFNRRTYDFEAEWKGVGFTEEALDKLVRKN